MQEPGRHHVQTARHLLEGWCTGKIYFKRVTLDELAQLDAEEEKKQRKGRSDKGFRRLPRGPDTCGKPKWSNGRVTSQEMISDTEDEIEDVSD